MHFRIFMIVVACGVLWSDALRVATSPPNTANSDNRFDRWLDGQVGTVLKHIDPDTFSNASTPMDEPKSPITPTSPYDTIPDCKYCGFEVEGPNKDN